MAKYIFGVFFAGFGLMVFEVVSSRLFAPYFGSNIFTWSAIISTVLGGLAYGYYAGGSWADKRKDEEGLGLLFVGSALSMLYVVVVSGIVFKFLLGLEIATNLSILLAAVLVLLPPTLVIGMIFPYFTRLQLVNIQHAGAKIGQVSAYGNIGSIMGALAGGFLLVPYFGVTSLLLALGAGFTLMSFWYGKTNKGGKVVLLLILLIGMWVFNKQEAVMWEKRSVNKIEGLYTPLYLYSVNPDNSRGEVVSNSVFAYQSGLMADNLASPINNYLKMFVLAGEAREAKKVLFIGGAMMGAPIAMLERDKQIAVEVVEIEPAYIEIFKERGLDYGERLKFFVQDGRSFLRSTEQKYDAVMLDAYTDGGMIPQHLATVEYFEELKTVLNKDGVVVVNVLGSVYGAKSSFVRAMHTGLSQVFSEVEVFSMGSPGSAANVVMVAGAQKIDWSRQKNHEFASLIERKYRGKIEQGMLLRDEYAPVERLSMEIKPQPFLVEKLSYTIKDLFIQ
jgi:spermidine synthase